MYCKKCGKVIADDSVFCPACGTNQNSNVHIDNQSNLQAETAQKLKPYKELKECTCLECGYKGLMGVVRKQKMPLRNKILLIVIEVVIYIIISWIFVYGWITILICAIVFGLIDAKSEKRVLFCPNCNRELIER